MRLAAAELVESREILPGPVAPVVPRPWLASGSRAGQFVHVRTRRLLGHGPASPVPLNTTDASTGIVTIHFRVTGQGTEWFTRLRPGDTIDMLGPLGRPFEVDPRSQHLLLIAGGLGMAGVRALADEAIRDGRQVTLLFGGASLREVYPSSLLPDEVEYVVATDDGSWATRLRDRAAARVRGLGRPGVRLRPGADARRPGPAGRPATGDSASRTWAASAAAGKADPSGRRRPGARRCCRSRWSRTWAARWARAWGASSWASGQPQRVCREGPVFASDELQWEGAWS